ncbi:AraC-like DNA-binding protein [Variovorax boronicumulans]|uniref:AraC-like ligand-binding domain-containing protein n=1 Tax=Variovorax boronicumulans TaxID=436515 RepID=UPI0027854835|nr:helix-turn-helix domain-containing protein [Variovorax boronicumulans]MDQ0083145.1 AraC-like DNA-binding protein [Variovorax boronicumulans]
MSTSTVTSTSILASTAGLDQHDKFGYWQDVVCRALVDLECRPVSGMAFEASVEGSCLEGLSVARIEASAHRVERQPSAISRASEESLIFNFVLSGVAMAQQDGRSVVLRAGDGAVCDAQRPYSLRFDDAFKILTIKMARSAIAHRAGSIHRITATSFGESSQMCPILFGYLVSFSKQASLLPPAASEKVARNFTELLAAALDEVILASPLPLSEYRATALMRVRDFVERHLDVCELDTSMVSTALNLSPRYINKLFEAENTSLTRYIWRRRLERAAADLQDPSRAGLGISAIAMAHGFNDLSHFSRAFRQRFDLSPRAYRASGIASGASTASAA